MLRRTKPCLFLVTLHSAAKYVALPDYAIWVDDKSCPGEPEKALANLEGFVGNVLFVTQDRVLCMACNNKHNQIFQHVKGGASLAISDSRQIPSALERDRHLSR